MSDKLEEAAAEVATVRKNGVVESAKMSVAGWAEMLGMSRLLSIAIDAITVAVGYAVGSSFDGVVGIAGYVLLAIGVLGLGWKVFKAVMGR